MRPGTGEAASSQPHDQNRIRHTVAVDNVGITEKHHNNRKFKHYLPIEIKGHQCGAIVDSGNRCRNIMSEDFATRIGIRTSDLRPLQQNTKVTSVSRFTRTRGNKGAASHEAKTHQQDLYDPTGCH